MLFELCANRGWPQCGFRAHGKSALIVLLLPRGVNRFTPSARDKSSLASPSRRGVGGKLDWRRSERERDGETYGVRSVGSSGYMNGSASSTVIFLIALGRYHSTCLSPRCRFVCIIFCCSMYERTLKHSTPYAWWR